MDPFLHSDGYNESVGRSTRTNLYTADGISDNLHNGKKPVETGVESSQDFTVQGQRKDLNTIFLKLRILDSTGQIRNIHFPFDIEVDTSNAVASEMVEELDLTDQDESAIAEMIDTEIQSYIPDWAAKLSADVGNDVPVSDNRITEVQVDSSTLMNESSHKSSFVMERLPSGRKYWSFSPKVSEGSSPVRPGPLILSIENMETPIDGRTEEYEQSPSCRNGPNDETLVEKQVTMSYNNLVDKKDNASNCSQFGTRDLQLGNGPNPDVVNKQIHYDFDIVDDSILVRKLKHVFVEHQRELDELKMKYELVVSDLLKEIPLESRNKFVEVCNMEMADHKIENGFPKPESFLHIKLKDFNTAVEGGNQNVGAESLVFGPIFRDKLKKAKMNAKSDISRIGIAVILRDKSVRRQ